MLARMCRIAIQKSLRAYVRSHHELKKNPATALSLKCSFRILKHLATCHTRPRRLFSWLPTACSLWKDKPISSAHSRYACISKPSSPASTKHVKISFFSCLPCMRAATDQGFILRSRRHNINDTPVMALTFVELYGVLHFLAWYGWEIDAFRP